MIRIGVLRVVVFEIKSRIRNVSHDKTVNIQSCSQSETKDDVHSMNKEHFKPRETATTVGMTYDGTNVNYRRFDS